MNFYNGRKAHVAIARLTNFTYKTQSDTGGGYWGWPSGRCHAAVGLACTSMSSKTSCEIISSWCFDRGQARNTKTAGETRADCFLRLVVCEVEASASNCARTNRLRRRINVNIVPEIALVSLVAAVPLRIFAARRIRVRESLCASAAPYRIFVRRKTFAPDCGSPANMLNKKRNGI